MIDHRHLLHRAVYTALLALDDAAYHAEKSDRHDADLLEALCREVADDVRAVLTTVEASK